MRLAAKTASVLLLACLAAFPAVAEVPLEGLFVARETCAAPRSIRTGANPDGVVAEIGRAYELLAGNRETPSHYLIRIPGAEPDRRWVEVGCGTRRSATAVPPVVAPPQRERRDRAKPSRAVDHVLAASWQPGFCETRPDNAECRTQTPDRFDASHFALHGLWPQPRNNVYCEVALEIAAADEAGRWEELPEIVLSGAVREELEKVMPGTASHLDRHEWIKHGTCHGGTMDEYYANALAAMRDLNRSSVRDLFEDSIGARLTSERIRDAFDEAFGPGAGARVRVACVTDPSSGRRLIGELTIGLSGGFDGTTGLAGMIHAAAPTSDAGCPGGIVDPAGLQ